MKANLISNTDGDVSSPTVDAFLTMKDFMWFAPKKTDVKKDGEK